MTGKRPVQLVALPEPKPCSRCHQLSEFGTQRGRAVHPSCEGFFDVLVGAEDQLVAVDLALTDIVQTLPVVALIDEATLAPVERRRVSWRTDVVCDICGTTEQVLVWHKVMGVAPFAPYTSARCSQHVTRDPWEW